MRNKFVYVFIVLGLFFISIGVFFIVTTEEKNDVKDDVVLDDTIVVDTSNVSGDTINSSTYEIYNFGDKTNTIEISKSDRPVSNQYSFSYPEKFKVDDITDKLLYLSDDNNFVIAADYLEGISLEDFQDYWIKDKKYSKYNIASSSEAICISEVSVKYFKITSLNSTGLYNEEFIVVFEDAKFGLVYVSFLIDSNRFSDEFLTDFLNSFEVIKSDEEYFGPFHSNDFLIGSLVVENNDVEYNLNYKISNLKYSTVKSEHNSKSLILFSSKNVFNLFAKILLKYTNTDSNFYVDYLNELKKEYDDSSEFFEVKEIKDSMQKYNDKEYYRIDFLLLNTANGGSSLGYSSYFIFKIDNGVYYIVNISSSEIVGEEILNDFLDVGLNKE